MKCSRLIFFLFVMPFLGCSDGKEESNTSADSSDESLAAEYFALHDGMTNAWNGVIRNDNDRIDALQRVITKLTQSDNEDPELMQSLDSRAQKLRQMQLTPGTLDNTAIVEEYDFACESLVSEVSAQAMASPVFPDDATLQSDVEKIRNADQETIDLRGAYDHEVRQFNEFVFRHKEIIMDIDKDCPKEGLPLFSPDGGEK